MNSEHEEEVRVQILSKRTMKRWGKNYHVLLLVQLQYWEPWIWPCWRCLAGVRSAASVDAACNLAFFLHRRLTSSVNLPQTGGTLVPPQNPFCLVVEAIGRPPTSMRGRPTTWRRGRPPTQRKRWPRPRGGEGGLYVEERAATHVDETTDPTWRTRQPPTWRKRWPRPFGEEGGHSRRENVGPGREEKRSAANVEETLALATWRRGWPPTLRKRWPRPRGEEGGHQRRGNDGPGHVEKEVLKLKILPISSWLILSSLTAGQFKTSWFWRLCQNCLVLKSLIFTSWFFLA